MSTSGSSSQAVSVPEKKPEVLTLGVDQVAVIRTQTGEAKLFKRNAFLSLQDRTLVEVTGVGIRDVILPGEMKTLLNKVTEAKKAAEANLITRREETAGMRSQANTAKLLDGSPTLMRLRELEVLEIVATSGKLNVVLGEKGLAERVVNLL